MKNSIENLIIIIVIMTLMFFGLGVYTNKVLTPTLTEAINKETTKIENNIETKINNKFKKINELTSNLSTPITARGTISNTNKEDCLKCGKDSICIAVKSLTRRQKRRLKLK